MNEQNNGGQPSLGREACPAISVVVPFHNSGRYLRECLDGLFAQAYPRDAFEVILVDNNSTDDSAKIASSYSEVALYQQPVTGSYAARNLGILKARAPIVATLDPDCSPAADWLSQIACGMQNSDCLVLLGHQKHANRSAPLELLEMYESEKVSYVTERRERDFYFGYTNNMAFRRNVFDAVGLFPERVRGGDTIFVRRVVNEFGCDAVAFNPQMEVTHLEVDTVGAYYSKRVIYGGSNERISRVLPFRHLRTRDRWTVFTDVVRKHKLPLRKALLLLALLAPGAALYHSGQLRAKLRGG